MKSCGYGQSQITLVSKSKDLPEEGDNDQVYHTCQRAGTSFEGKLHSQMRATLMVAIVV